jgi:hypothetical protein
MKLNLRENADEIRVHLIREQPIGTSMPAVEAWIKKAGWKYSASPNVGFLKQEDRKNSVVGASSIKADIGDYWRFPFLTTSVVAYWGFGPDGKLIDVWVWKTTDGP